jgi:hypothetical protein
LKRSAEAHPHIVPAITFTQVTSEHKIVLVEGNYLLLYDVEPWNELRELFDEKWYIACPESTSRERVYKRHLEVSCVCDSGLPNDLFLLRQPRRSPHDSVLRTLLVLLRLQLRLQVGSTPESATFRLEDNDLPNARLIAETAKYADHVVTTR